ncbi:uncharacterized protein LOC129590540 isoform X2 [Paramacrobiotus metropolitanus]|uniref:uncharacterized protein LOC129590540 isoform X2 n=1 Tax=Paramacrobiotus metropolitanus TaxID=2943436 RepID=UPI002445A830|nr:uncharacterized protein LOC129590540 isoform X2 [Paramacrobiotus metropolitanus]
MNDIRDCASREPPLTSALTDEPDGRESPEIAAPPVGPVSMVPPHATRNAGRRRPAATPRKRRTRRKAAVNDAQRATTDSVFEEDSHGMATVRGVVRGVGLQLRDAHEQGTLSSGKGINMYFTPKTADAREDIIQLFDDNVSLAEIARRVKLCVTTVSHVLLSAGRSAKDRKIHRNGRRKKGQTNRRPLARPIAVEQDTGLTLPDTGGWPLISDEMPTVRDSGKVPVHVRSRRSQSHKTKKRKLPSGKKRKRPARDPIAEVIVQPHIEADTWNTATAAFNAACPESALRADGASQPPNVAVIGCHGSAWDSQYHCEVCLFYTTAETSFIGHLLSGPHQQRTSGALLVCTNCKLKTHRRDRMLHHCITHRPGCWQLQPALLRLAAHP